MTKRKLSEEQEKQLVAEYVAGASSQSLCMKYGFNSDESIRNILKRNNMSPRPVGVTNAKHNTQHRYFEKGVDSPSAARLLGLLITDGSIHYKQGSSIIHFGNTDKELAQFVHEQLGGAFYTGKNSAGTPYYRVQVYSKTLVEDLEHFGVTEAKSLTFALRPGTIPEHLRLPFLVGLIEGDGCISRSAQSIAIQVSVVTGSPVFAEQLAKLYQEMTLRRVQTKTGRIYQLTCGVTLRTESFLRDLEAAWLSCNALERKVEILSTRLNLPIRRTG